MCEAPHTRECIQCGLCLEACPTYVQSMDEGLSPRGRISLIRELAQGNGAFTAETGRVLDLCLVCRSCEAACPSGVKLGWVFPESRQWVSHLRASRRDRWIRILLHSVLARTWPRRMVIRTLRDACRSGVARLLVRLFFARRHRAHFLHLISSIRGDEVPTPPVASFERPPVAPADVRPVLLFRGCVTPVFFPRVMQAWESLLHKAGLEVSMPKRQTCCGALHWNQGFLSDARALARKNIEAFEAAGPGWILTESAGCGAALKGYGELLADDPEYAERARRFAARVRDTMEVLAQWDLQPQASDPERDAGRRIVYQEPCHHRHVQGTTAHAHGLMAGGGRQGMAEAPEPDECCGGAGLYNLLQPAMSAALGDRKAELLAARGVDLVVTSDPGCRTQLQGRLKARGVPIRHLLEVLDQMWPPKGGDSHE